MPHIAPFELSPARGRVGMFFYPGHEPGTRGQLRQPDVIVIESCVVRLSPPAGRSTNRADPYSFFLPPGAAEPGAMLEVELRGRGVPAEVVPLPFYKRPR